MEGPRRLRSEKYWRWTAGILVGIALVIGCNPITLSGYILQSFMDSKIPPKCKISGDKEKTVVIAPFFGYLEQRPEHQGIERDLGDRLAAALKKRFEDNREKVKIVPSARVYGYLNQASGTLDKHELGKHFNADYVIALEIQAFSLFEPRSRDVLRGNTEINVAVLDMSQVKGESTIFDEIYRFQFPKNWGQDAAGNGSLGAFRVMFLTHMAKDLSRWFAAYPMEERLD
jgi:hypothetical protein